MDCAKAVGARIAYLPSGFTNIVETDIPMLAKYADQEANPLYPVPALMDAKELEKIYHLAILK